MKTKQIIHASLIALAATSAHADSIRLLDEAGTHGSAIKLSQVAELEGDYAKSLGDLVVYEAEGSSANVVLTMSSLREVLTKAGANWSDLSLSGRRTCNVSVMPAELVKTEVNTVNDRAVSHNDVMAVNQANAGRTIADLVREEIARSSGVSPKQLDIVFASSREELAWLTRSAAVGRFELESLSRSGLGRVPVKVRRYDPSGTVEEATLTATVSRQAKALVATRQLRRGEAFTSENVALRDVLLTSDHGTPLDEIALIQGQNAASSLREGTVLLADHVAPDVLVKRGDLVTVAAVSGRLVVRTVGRAAEDGSMGDLIGVRSEQTREVFYAVVSGDRQATVARYADATASLDKPRQPEP